MSKTAKWRTWAHSNTYENATFHVLGSDHWPYCRLNPVFPQPANKFTEYLTAGLYILSSPGLTDPARLIQEHHLGELVTPEEVRRSLSPERLTDLARQISRSSDREARLERIRLLLQSTLNMDICVRTFVYDLKNDHAVPPLRLKSQNRHATVTEAVPPASPK